MSKKWNNGLQSEPVTTYVSEETKKSWQAHSDNLDVPLSRFVEMMVNAGRSIYEDSAPEGFETEDMASARRKINALEDELDQVKAHPQTDEVFRIYSVLDEEDYVGTQALSDETNSSESAVYESLQKLMDEDLVEYDPMKNGYRKT